MTYITCVPVPVPVPVPVLRMISLDCFRIFTTYYPEWHISYQ